MTDPAEELREYIYSDSEDEAARLEAVLDAALAAAYQRGRLDGDTAAANYEAGWKMGHQRGQTDERERIRAAVHEAPTTRDGLVNWYTLSDILDAGADR